MELNEKITGIDKDIYKGQSFYNHMKLVGRVSQIKEKRREYPKYPNPNYEKDHNYAIEFIVETKRKSGKSDFIPVIFRTSDEVELEVGERVKIYGRFRCIPGEHFVSKVVAYDIERLRSNEENDASSLQIVAKLSKKSEMRDTPLTQTQIVDALFFIPGCENRSEQFHSVCFGKQAYAAENLMRGDICYIEARVESRAYIKQQTGEEKVAYEICPYVMKKLTDEHQSYDKSYKHFMTDEIPAKRLDITKK